MAVGVIVKVLINPVASDTAAYIPELTLPDAPTTVATTESCPPALRNVPLSLSCQTKGIGNNSLPNDATNVAWLPVPSTNVALDTGWIGTTGGVHVIAWNTPDAICANILYRIATAPAPARHSITAESAARTDLGHTGYTGLR